jgi:hypothetical protein
MTDGERDLVFDATVDAYNAIEALAYERGATDDEIDARIGEMFDDSDYPDELRERWDDAWTPPSEAHGPRPADEPLLCDWCGANEADIGIRVRLESIIGRTKLRFFCGDQCRAKFVRDMG